MFIWTVGEYIENQEVNDRCEKNKADIILTQKNDRYEKGDGP